MITLDLPADGRRWRPGTLVDVGHHHLGIDRGLDLGEQVLARCLDDATWLMCVEDLEFGLADTRYLLAAERPVQEADRARLPAAGRMLTTADTAALLHALGRRNRAPHQAPDQAPQPAAAETTAGRRG